MRQNTRRELPHTCEKCKTDRLVFSFLLHRVKKFCCIKDTISATYLMIITPFA